MHRDFKTLSWIKIFNDKVYNIKLQILLYLLYTIYFPVCMQCVCTVDNSVLAEGRPRPQSPFRPEPQGTAGLNIWLSSRDSRTHKPDMGHPASFHHPARRVAHSKCTVGCTENLLQCTSRIWQRLQVLISV